jgi:hypothetical protein
VWVLPSDKIRTKGLTLKGVAEANRVYMEHLRKLFMTKNNILNQNISKAAIYRIPSINTKNGS